MEGSVFGAEGNGGVAELFDGAFDVGDGDGVADGRAVLDVAAGGDVA